MEGNMNYLLVLFVGVILFAVGVGATAAQFAAMAVTGMPQVSLAFLLGIVALLVGLGVILLGALSWYGPVFARWAMVTCVAPIVGLMIGVPFEVVGWNDAATAIFMVALVILVLGMGNLFLVIKKKSIRP